MQCMFVGICTSSTLFLFILLLCTLVTTYTVCYIAIYLWTLNDTKLSVPNIHQIDSGTDRFKQPKLVSEVLWLQLRFCLPTMQFTTRINLLPKPLGFPLRYFHGIVCSQCQLVVYCQTMLYIWQIAFNLYIGRTCNNR